MGIAGVNSRRRITVRAGRTLQFDHWMLLIVAALTVIGMLMVYSTSFDLGLRLFNDPTHYFTRQLVAVLLGLVGIVIILRFDYHVLRKFSLPLLVLSLLMIVAVILLGETSLGARRGILAGSYQPQEIAKLATIIYVAHWISSKGDQIKTATYGLLPFAIIVGVVTALVVIQPDLSTGAVIATIGLTMFFVAGADLRQFAIAGGAIAGIFLILITTIPHAIERVSSYQRALKDPLHAGWQIQQTIIALGNGGLFGVGLGEGTQKFGPLPAAHTDGVFAILGEELGLVGGLLVVALFIALTWRGLRTATRARDSFGALLAVGISVWLALQALLNLAVITSVIPFTGMPLPFLSYGGSSMLMTLLGIGILLSVSRDAAIGAKYQGAVPLKESVRESRNMRGRDRRSHVSGARRSRRP